MRRAGTYAVVSGVCASALLGCAGTQDLLAVLNAALVQGPVEAKPCRGLVCDPQRWATILIDTRGVGAAGCFYRLEFVSPVPASGEETLPAVIDGDARREDARLALAISDNRLVLADLGSQEADQQVALPVRAVRWSNAGTRLAAVLESAEPDAGERVSLSVLDEQLVELVRWPLPLDPVREDMRTLVEDRIPPLTYTLSWSAADREIAVCGPQSSPRCVIVALDSGQVRSVPGRRAFFLGDDRLVVVQSPRAAGIQAQVAVVRWQQGDVLEERAVAGARDVLTTDAPTGVMLSLEPNPSLYAPLLAVPAMVALRTADTGPQVISPTGPGLSLWKIVPLAPGQQETDLLDTSGNDPNNVCPAR